MGGHSIHFATYRIPQLYEWMYSHGVVPEPEAPPTVMVVPRCVV